MKKIINVSVLLLMCLNIAAQNPRHEFRIMHVSPNGVKIADKVMEEYDLFNETQEIKWLKPDASMVVKAQTDIPFTPQGGKTQMWWYKGTSLKVRAKDSFGKKNNLFWWIKLNKANAKGNADFSQKFDMYENELIIELPEVLKKNQGYRFESISNGKSFFSINEDEKPLIKITREFLDSIGFDGDSIVLKVYYYNGHNIPKLISDSMKIVNH